MFIYKYAKMVAPMQNLTKKVVPFVWGEAQQKAMDNVKKAVKESGAIRPLKYRSDREVVLNVDSCYLSIGFYICQEDENDPRKRIYMRFASITLNEREARYSQPKRELLEL